MKKDRGLTGMYYDYAMAAPFMSGGMEEGESTDTAHFFHPVFALIKYTSPRIRSTPEKIRKVIAVPTAGMVTKVGRNVPIMLPMVLNAPRFPTALALGNIYGGRSADKNPNPDRLYGRILIAAVWIAAIPVIGKYIILGISALLIVTVNTNFLIWAAFLACMKYGPFIKCVQNKFLRASL